MSPQEQIKHIDRLIDANRRALMARVHCAPGMSSRNWQSAWDRCPDLWTRDKELFRQRGDAQQARDAQLEREWQTEQRRKRAAARKASAVRKVCPACGSLTLAA